VGTYVRDRAAARERPLPTSDRAEPIERRALWTAEDAARELPNLPLEDPLQLVHLYFKLQQVDATDENTRTGRWPVLVFEKKTRRHGHPITRSS
jgi:hypothetical protein